MSIVRIEKLCEGCFFFNFSIKDMRDTPASAVEEKGFPPN